jgi:hypothetical protein
VSSSSKVLDNFPPLCSMSPIHKLVAFVSWPIVNITFECDWERVGNFLMDCLDSM